MFPFSGWWAILYPSWQLLDDRLWELYCSTAVFLYFLCHSHLHCTQPTSGWVASLLFCFYTFCVILALIVLNLLVGELFHCCSCFNSLLCRGTRWFFNLGWGGGFLFFTIEFVVLTKLRIYFITCSLQDEMCIYRKKNLSKLEVCFVCTVARELECTYYLPGVTTTNVCAFVVLVSLDTL